MDIWGKLTAFLSNQAPAMLTKLVVAALILVLARVIGGTLATTVGRMLEKHRDGALKQILSKLVKTVVMIIGVLTALDHLGIDIKTLLAGAGILGLAIGFGAQSLVKDVISGFFILFDDVLRVGDFAKVGEASGVVEDVGLRLTCVRSFNGQLWYINNGNISNVGNFNRQWSRAIAEVGVAYEQDVGLGLQILQQVGDAYAKD
ncbi:MAG: small-conductance mechanosensitive channel, partial [Myxococcota bacterium]